MILCDWPLSFTSNLSRIKRGLARRAKPGEMTPAGKDCKRILMINGSCHGGGTTEMLPKLLSLRLHGITPALVAW